MEEVPDAAGGRCRDAMPGSGSDYEFDYTIPCPRSVDGRIAFDLNALTPGRHTVETTVEDASGNRRLIHSVQIEVISDPTRRRFDTAGVAGLTNPLGDRPGYVQNGSGATRAAVLTAYVRRGAGKRSRQATTTFPHTPTVMGRLEDAGRPVAGAVVSVLQRLSDSTQWQVLSTGQTTSDGNIVVTLPAGPSREIRLAYFADSEATSFISSNTLDLRVKPRVILRGSQRTRQTGQRLRFSGEVRGGTVPPNGLVIRLEAGTARSRWIAFRTVRTHPSGQFRASYRFTNTHGVVRYRFRAVVQRQASYPFAAGSSRAVWVRVSG